MQHAPRGVWLPGKLCGQMQRDAFDVLHQSDGIAEDLMVDALQDGALFAPVHAASHPVGVIDVPIAKRRCTPTRTGQLEVTHHGIYSWLIDDYAHRFSGYFPAATSARMLATTLGWSSR